MGERLESFHSFLFYSKDEILNSIYIGTGGVFMEDITEMLKGILEGCILDIINRKNTYGYEITRKLNEFGFKDVVEGTVYTILIRFEKNKLVDIQKKRSELGPPRKIYSLNDKGRKELRVFWKKWEFLSSKINELGENKNYE